MTNIPELDGVITRAEMIMTAEHLASLHDRERHRRVNQEYPDQERQQTQCHEIDTKRARDFRERRIAALRGE